MWSSANLRKLVSLLLRAGAEADQETSRGRTAFDLAGQDWLVLKALGGQTKSLDVVSREETFSYKAFSKQEVVLLDRGF